MKLKRKPLVITGVCVLVVAVCLVVLFAVLKTPTTQPTNPPGGIDGLISVYVYGDVFVIQEDGFIFENPESNKYQLAFEICWNDGVLFKSEYIDPGASVKWDTMTVDTGFYDCQINVSSRDPETGTEGNRVYIRQIFYIDDTAPLETYKLFKVSVPAQSYFTVENEQIELVHNQVVVEKQTHADGSPLPRTEAINMVADAIVLGETLVQIEIAKVVADEADLQYIIEMQAKVVDGAVKDGNYAEQFGFFFDWFSQENVLVP